jgi:hypothetical protein
MSRDGDTYRRALRLIVCCVLWALAWIALAGIQQIVDAKIIPALILVFNSTTKHEVRNEATWALANALSNGSDEQIRYGMLCLVP